MQSITLNVTASHVIEAVYRCGWEEIDVVAMLNELFNATQAPVSDGFADCFANLRKAYLEEAEDYREPQNESGKNRLEEAQDALKVFKKWEQAQ